MAGEATLQGVQKTLAPLAPVSEALGRAALGPLYEAGKITNQLASQALGDEITWKNWGLKFWTDGPVAVVASAFGRDVTPHGKAIGPDVKKLAKRLSSEPSYGAGFAQLSRGLRRWDVACVGLCEPHREGYRAVAEAGGIAIRNVAVSELKGAGFKVDARHGKSVPIAFRSEEEAMAFNFTALPSNYGGTIGGFKGLTDILSKGIDTAASVYGAKLAAKTAQTQAEAAARVAVAQSKTSLANTPPQITNREVPTVDLGGWLNSMLQATPGRVPTAEPIVGSPNAIGLQTGPSIGGLNLGDPMTLLLLGAAAYLFLRR